MNPRGRVRALSGFSLIEILVAASILLVVGGALFPLLTVGWDVWRRSVQTAGRAYDTLEWMNTLKADLQSAVVVGGMRFAEFEGESDSLAFIRPVSEPKRGRGLARVLYRASDDGSLVRELNPLVWDTGDDAPAPTRRTLSGKVVFSYAEESEKGLQWSDAWPGGTNLPAAVQVEFSGRETVKSLILMPPGPRIEAEQGKRRLPRERE